MVVATEPQSVGSVGGRQDSEAISDQVVAEQLECLGIVLADDQVGDLTALGKHWPV